MKLVERLEALTAPCRKIDLMIMRYVENIGGDAANALRYTASIDAAMTLISDWAWIAVRHLLASAAREMGEMGVDPIDYLPRYICIQALKAKARELNNG